MSISSRPIVTVVAAVVAAGFLSGCSYKHMVIDASFTMAEDAIRAFYADPDPVFAAEAAPANLKLVEGMALGDPGNEEIQLAASQLFALYTFGFLEDSVDDEEAQAAVNHRAKGLYLRGRDFALRVLEQRTGFAEAYDRDLPDFEAWLATLDEDDGPALFWTAFNWGLYINLSRDDLEALADIPKVVAMIKRANTLSPGLFYGGGHLFLMVFNASMGPVVGGQPEQALREYELAIGAADGKFLMTKYLFARYYGAQTLNRELFEKVLGEVLAAPADILPEMRLANTLAKEKAGRLLSQADDIF